MEVNKWKIRLKIQPAIMAAQRAQNWNGSNCAPGACSSRRSRPASACARRRVPRRSSRGSWSAGGSRAEQRLLGGLAYIAGLGSFRMRSMGQRATTSQLDADLLIGAMRQLYEQLEGLDDDDLSFKCPVTGRGLRKAYYEIGATPGSAFLMREPRGNNRGSELC